MPRPRLLRSRRGWRGVRISPVKTPVQPAIDAMRTSLFWFPLILLIVGGCSSSRQPEASKPQLTDPVISSPVTADRVPNPVEIVRQAGATPEDGATKGSYSPIDGSWTAYGNFPSSPENQQVIAYTQFSVNSYPDRKSLEKWLVQVQTDDTQKVLVGNDRPFYAVIVGLSDGTFDVDPAVVAARINATLKP